MDSSSETQKILSRILKIRPLQHFSPPSCSKFRSSYPNTPIPRLQVCLKRLEGKLYSRGISDSLVEQLCNTALQHIRRSNNFEEACAQLIALPRAPTDEPIELLLSKLQRVYNTFLNDRLLVQLESEIISQLDAAQRKQRGTNEKKRPTFNHEFTPLLEKYFEYNAYPSAQDRELLARKSMMEPRQIEVWFQNHRTRAKKDGVMLKKLCQNPLPVDLNLQTLSSSMPLFAESQKKEQEGSPTLSARRSRGEAKPTATKISDIFSTAAPAHAFPDVYPPASPFPSFPQFPPPVWRRTPCSKVKQQVRHIDVNELAVEFQQKLQIRGSESSAKCTSKRSSWYSIVTVPGPAPHPAMINTQSPPRISTRARTPLPKFASSSLTASRLPRRLPSARARAPYSRTPSNSSVSSVDSDDLVTPPASPALLSQFIGFCESKTSFLNKHFDSGHRVLRHMCPLSTTLT